MIKMHKTYIFFSQETAFPITYGTDKNLKRKKKCAKYFFEHTGKKNLFKYFLVKNSFVIFKAIQNIPTVQNKLDK